MFTPRGIPLATILQSRMVINTSIRMEEKGGELLIVIPRKKGFLVNLLSLFLVVPREKKVSLDEMGMKIFRDCQAEITVSEVIERFRKRHNVSAEYSRKSVVTYLDLLARKGVVGFLVETEKPGTS